MSQWARNLTTHVYYKMSRVTRASSHTLGPYDEGGETRRRQRHESKFRRP